MPLNKEELDRAIVNINFRLDQLSIDCFFDETYLCGSGCKENVSEFNDIDLAFKFTKEGLLKYKNKVDALPYELNLDILYTYGNPLKEFTKSDGSRVYWEKYGIYRQYLMYKLEQIHPIKPASHYCVLIIADKVKDTDFGDGLRDWEEFKKQKYIRLYPSKY